MKNIIIFILKLAAGLAAFAIIFVLSVNLYVVFSTRSSIYDSANELPNEEYAGILVLGCSVRENGEASPMLADRVERAVEVYNESKAKMILMSGDHRVDSYNEVGKMSELAQEAGVPRSVIYLDHIGLNTYDSIVHAKDFFGDGKVIIISQRYHLYRAVYLARAMGLDACGVAASGDTYTGQMYREVRETAARVKDFFFGILKPERVGPVEKDITN